MTAWWNDEFERPAGLIVNKVMGISAALGGDVMIANNNQHSPAPHAGQPSHPSPNRQTKRKANKKIKGKGKQNYGSPNAAAAASLYCIICKGTDHMMQQCSQYDPNHGKGPKGGKGKGGKPKGGKDSKGKAKGW
jgi:hypothetical protein